MEENWPNGLREQLLRKKDELNARLERITANLRRGLESDSKERAKQLEDSDVVDALVNEISLFPLDSFVLLDSGEIGRVVATNSGNMMRPTIETVWDAQWNPIAQPRRIDLAKTPGSSIVRPLHETEVPIT